MKIVKLKGGLGNQMFQYAFAKNIEMSTEEDVKMDLSAYEVRKNDDVRKPRIFDFRIVEKIANQNEIMKMCKINHNYDLLSLQYKLGVQIENIINPNYFFMRECKYIPIEEICKYQYFDGYWQTWKYIDAVKDQLKKEFVPKKELSSQSKNMIEILKNQNSVFVGIRKGDYNSTWIRKRMYGDFKVQYYIEAMNYICNLVEDPVFYIFSNDIEWVKKYIVLNGFNICYRDIKDQISDFEEMLIMSSCRHSIIVNSTFYWWAAWLNDYPEKIVVAPDQWFTNGWKDELIPPDWVKMKRQ